MADSIFAVIGAVLGFYFGELDGLLIVMCIFTVVDYVTGVTSAILKKELSSEVGFKGLFKKMMIFIFIGMANLLDVHVIGSGQVLRTAVIFFYLSNEGLSIMENAAEIGLPIPEALTKYLKKINEKAENTETETDGEKNEDN